MLNRKYRDLTAAEQQILEHGTLRLLTTPADLARCDQAIRDHHYLHSATLVGEHLRYAFTYRGQWLAVATWSAAAFHLKAREAFIGWSPEQCRRRRSLIANNTRLLVLPEGHSPNLISRFMKLMLARLSADWEARWGHPIALVETFVDPQFYQGTAYKVSGWSHLGRTAGWKRTADDFYEPHDTPKQIWVRELVNKACVHLRSPILPPAWASVEAAVAPRCTTPAAELRSLRDLVQAEIPEFRRPQALAYPVAGLICLIVMAAAQGVTRGPKDLADYADALSQGQLRALGFRRAPGRREIRCPKKTTFSRVLPQLPDDQVERVLLRWQEQILGPVQDRLVILDGKAVRHGGVEIVNAVTSTGRFLGSVLTDAKSNEIPAGRDLLRPLDLVGKLVVADALHTQVATGQQILFEQGGDFLFTVKGNQPTVQATLEGLFTQQAFPPSTHAGDAGDDARTQLRAAGDSRGALPGSDAQPGGVPRGATGRPAGDPGQAGSAMEPAGGLFAEQSAAGRPGGAGAVGLEAGLLGDRKPAAPLFGRDLARGSEPSAHADLGARAGDDPAGGGEPGQRGGGSSAATESQEQSHHG